MSASPAAFINNFNGFLKRNNPVEAIALGMAQTLYNLVTFRSRMKLYKFKYLMELEKLEKMQAVLGAKGFYKASSSDSAKMNRVY